MKVIDFRSLRDWSIIFVLIMAYLMILRDRAFMSALLVASLLTAFAIIMDMLHKSERAALRFIGVALSTILATMMFTVVALFLIVYLAGIDRGWLPPGIALVIGLAGGSVYGVRRWRRYKPSAWKRSDPQS